MGTRCQKILRKKRIRISEKPVKFEQSAQSLSMIFPRDLLNSGLLFSSGLQDKLN